MIEDVQVLGASGPVVLLLPGDAGSCAGFFPGLTRGLVRDPGCRVILYDRPGTGTSASAGSLAEAPAHLGAVIDELGFGPVIVVGHGLGAVVALHLARDHAEKVAGLVLLDPTPINDLRLCDRFERLLRTLGVLASFPVFHWLLTAMLRLDGGRGGRWQHIRPDCAVAMERARRRLDLPRLGRAMRGLTVLSAAFREMDLPKVPAVLVTAEREPEHEMRKAHIRLATALGARLVCWPGATPVVQLDYPDETLAVVRELVQCVDRPA
ncbi:alpha/beta fold hydrolase [Amycolatopsis thailandensis]|uniref:alpha/beta fold hydrolase n=1 Tax=Amycolatopsis thailandensis TaxID=589330 RepID=UPI0036454FF7